MRLLGLCLTVAVVRTAAFSLSATLGDHMVLSWKDAVVWGFDTPGSSVKVQIMGTDNSLTTTTVGCPSRFARPGFLWRVPSARGRTEC